MPLIALSLAQLPLLALEHLQPLNTCDFPAGQGFHAASLCSYFVDFGALLATTQYSKT